MSDSVIKKYEYVFGPVPSRRLGASLGVDVLPLKTCTQNCIYCQLCVDQDPIIDIRTYANPQQVIDEVISRIKEGIKVDYITFSGSGEPTLHKDLGFMIDSIKEKTGKKVAVITNGTMLWKPEVRKGLANADLVMPSLDAFDSESFKIINRPHDKITFDLLVEGLTSFRKEYVGQIWLEIFLIKGINTVFDSLKTLKLLVKGINPDRIQLNTVARPGVDKTLKPLSQEEMLEIARIIGYDAEGISLAGNIEKSSDTANIEEKVLDMLKRRDCRSEDLANGLQVELSRVVSVLDELENQGIVVRVNRGEDVFFERKN